MPAYNSKHSWEPISAVLVTLGVFFGGQIAAIAMISWYGQIRGFEAKAITRMLQDNAAWQFSYIIITGIITLLLLRLFIYSRDINWTDLGLTKPSVKNILTGIPVFGLYLITLIPVLSLVSYLAPSIDLDQKQQIGFETASQSGMLVLVFIALVIFQPIVEEIIVRGFLYGGLKNRLPKLSSALITSLIFAIAHLQLGSGTPPLWIAAVDTFVLSMFLIWLRERTGNLGAPIAVHMMKNGLAFIVLFT